MSSTLPSVFLSYARADDEPFVKRLYGKLVEAGFEVWWDRVSMPSRSLTFQREIRDAIEAHDRTIVLLGPNAIESEYVRAEWQYALAADKVVSPVLRAGTYDIVPAELALLHCVNATRERDEPDAMAEILRIATEPPPPVGRTVNVPTPPPHFHPRVDDFTQLASRFVIENERRIELPVSQRTIVLQGMTGLGKSVLAASVARATATRRLFPDGVIWLGFGAESKSPASQVRQALNALDEGKYEGRRDDSDLLKTRLESAAALLVLDNVWWDEQAYPFRTALGRRCQMLITTREAGLATRLGAELHQLDLLSPDASRALLADWIGVEKESLPPTASAVADECNRLPFALALVGAMAAIGTSWDDLLDALKTADLGFIQNKLPGYEFSDLLRAQQVSVEFMRRSDDPAVARAAERYLELSAFRWARPIPESAIVTRWLGTGTYTEREARQALTILASMALLRADGASPNRLVSLHDLQQDYLVARTPSMAVAHAGILDAYAARYADGPVTAKDDGYYFDNLFHHLQLAGRAAEMHALLRVESDRGRNAWWDARIDRGQALGYEDDLRRALANTSDVALVDPADVSSTDVARLARYALMIGSVRDAVVGVSPAGLKQLLSSGRWNTDQALTAARRQLNATDRVEYLVAVLPWLHGSAKQDVVDEAVANANSLAEIADTTRRLLMVATAVEGASRLAILRHVVELARQDSPEHRFHDLEAAWHLNTEAIEWLEEAFQLLENDVDRWTREAAIQSLASVVPTPFLWRLVALARQFKDGVVRASSLLAIAGSLPAHERAALATEAYESADKAREGERVELFARAARWLSGDLRWQAVRKARAAFQRLERKQVALDRLAALLPVLEGKSRTAAEVKLHGGIAKLDSARTVEALLVECLTPGGLRETSPPLFQALVDPLVAAARRDSDGYARREALSALAGLADVLIEHETMGDEGILTRPIGDQQDRVECLTALCEQLDTSSRVPWVDRILDLPALRAMLVDDAIRRVTRLATVEQLERASGRQDPDDEFTFNSIASAFASGFAHHGRWDRVDDMLERTDGADGLALALDGFPDSVPPAMAQRIVESCAEKGDAELVAAAVPRLAKHLPSDERDGTVRFGFSMIEHLASPGGRTDLVRDILPLLPCDLLGDVQRRLRETPDDFLDITAEVGVRLTRRLYQCGSTHDAIDVMSGIPSKRARVFALIDLVELGGDLQTKLAGLAEKIVTDAPPDVAVEVLVRLAACATPDEHDRLLTKANALAVSSPSGNADQREERAGALFWLATVVSEPQRTELLVEAWRLALRRSISLWLGHRVIRSLVPHLAQLPKARLLGQWCSDLVVASDNRKAVLRELSVVSGVVERLGGQVGVLEILTAVDDVARWWPDA